MGVLFIVAVGGIYAAACDAVNHARRPHLLLTIYGLVIFLIYSAIPYKTPWLALNLWLPLALVCGFGVAAIWEQMKTAAGRWFVGIAVLFLLGILAAQTKRLAFDQPADEKNPYAYAHTGEDLLGLPPRLEELAKGKNLPQPRVAVVAADPWPLPWYLRKFSNVGYWQPGQATGPADFFITSTAAAGQMEDQLKNYRPEFFGVRPEVLIILWVPATQKANHDILNAEAQSRSADSLSASSWHLPHPAKPVHARALFLSSAILRALRSTISQHRCVLRRFFVLVLVLDFYAFRRRGQERGRSSCAEPSCLCPIFAFSAVVFVFPAILHPPSSILLGCGFAALRLCVYPLSIQ